MLPTPSTSHLSFENIYEPSEDSYLLLDALSDAAQVEYLHGRFSPPSPVPVVLEVGPGSGVVLAFVAANAQAILSRSDVVTLGVDVNVFACKGTAQTVAGAVNGQSGDSSGSGIWLDCIRGDLVGPFRDHSVDILIFNPPYVPSETLPSIPHPANADADEIGAEVRFARDSSLLALATDGGADGMQITHALLWQLHRVLSDRGVAYVLLCAQNKPDKVKAMVRDWGRDWEVETVYTSGKKGGWEKLQILRVSRRVNGWEV